MQQISLSATVEWLAPLVRYLATIDIPADLHRAWRHQRIAHQPVIMPLVDEPIERPKKIMPLYMARQKKLSEALETALGEEWYVRPISNNQAYKFSKGGKPKDNSVICTILPRWTCFLYDLSADEQQIIPGNTFKNGPQYNLQLAAYRFPSLSEKVAALICAD